MYFRKRKKKPKGIPANTAMPMAEKRVPFPDGIFSLLENQRKPLGVFLKDKF